MIAPAMTFEVWERTTELRWKPLSGEDKPRFVLQQAWRTPDGRIEWRDVPKILYGGAPDAGR